MTAGSLWGELMAVRRMFSLEVVDTDAFLDLPASSQNLYFHLGMRADDDGFVSSPKKITTLVNCSADDLKLLVAKGFIIPFDSGVCVIRDWRTNNYLRPDRYHETRHLAEKRQLSLTETGAYQALPTNGIPMVDTLATEVRLGKDRIVKESKADKPPQRKRFVPPSVDEVEAYCTERGNHVDAAKFCAFYESKGWLVGNQPMKSWQAAVLTWERRERKDRAEQEKEGTSAYEHEL